MEEITNIRYENENKLIKKNKDIIIGIRILRIVLSFMVVMDHFYNKKKIQNYHYILYYHIPCFFLISFFFTYKTFSSFNIQKIKLRLERILIPYFCWSIISWIIRIIYFYKMEKNCEHSFRDFISNLINGHIFNVVLWFQNILILVTLIFLIILFTFKFYYLLVFQILFIISYFLQYSSINYNFFQKYFSKHSRSTFGRFFEAIPHAITGFILGKFDIIKLIKKKKITIFFFTLIFLILISKYEVFADLKTYKYGGFRLNIASVCIFILFSLIPNKIYNCKLKNSIIMEMTNYTGGVYFTHYLVGTGYICSSINLVKKRTILGCIIIYLLSYGLSFIGIKFLGNTKLKHLFI